jgi:hypothetical protein
MKREGAGNTLALDDKLGSTIIYLQVKLIQFQIIGKGNTSCLKIFFLNPRH